VRTFSTEIKAARTRAARAAQQGRAGGTPHGIDARALSLGVDPAVPAQRQARHTKKPQTAEVAWRFGAAWAVVA
jgi:hypothetical protein